MTVVALGSAISSRDRGHLILVLKRVDELIERGDHVSALDQVRAERQDGCHQTPAERLHTHHFVILDVALLVDLTGGLQHGVSLICAEELHLFSILVVEERIVDQELLDVVATVVTRVREALRLHEPQQVVVRPHLDVLLVQRADLG